MHISFHLIPSKYQNENEKREEKSEKAKKRRAKVINTYDPAYWY